MEDRTRTQTATEGHAQSPVNQSDPGPLGILTAGLLVLMLGALLFAGLAVAIGELPAILLTVLAFAGLVWWLIPTAEEPNEHAQRLLNGRESADGGRRAPGMLAAVLLCLVGIGTVPGCESTATQAAHESLASNRDELDPMTLRGIDDAVADGDISPALAEQYRGLLNDNNALIDALLGREPTQPVGVHQLDTPR